MKTITILFFAAVSAFGQATITIPDIDSTGFSLPLTVSSSGFSDIVAWILGVQPVTGLWPNATGAPIPTTLAAAITTTTGPCSGVTGASAGANCTTVSLASATNLAQCNGLIIDLEAMLVYSVSGQSVVVARGMLGTTKATHLIGAVVTPIRSGGGTCLLKAFDADGVAQAVLAKCADAICAAAAANIVSNTMTKSSTASGAIQ
jgi:hypothetical protein